jgi:hypothetical protein
MTRSSIGRGLVLLVLCLVPPLSSLLPLSAVAHADGNVSAVVRNGQLILRGDSQDNQIRITTDGAPAGGVTLIPAIHTTINRQEVAFLDVPNIPRGVRAGFGGGEDTFGGSELESFPGDLIVDMGGENDTLAFTDLFVDGRCDINMGAGHDNFGFDTMVCDEVRIRGGSGEDHMVWQLGGVSGRTDIGMSGGDDNVALEGIGFGGPVRVVMGGDDDFLEVELFNSFAGTAFFSGGASNVDGISDDGTNEYAIDPVVVHFEQQ